MAKPNPSSKAAFMVIGLSVLNLCVVSAEPEFRTWEDVVRKAEMGGGAPIEQWLVGNHYLWTGEHAKAITWFHRAEHQGVQIAQSMLVLMYSNGIGVERDYKEACKYFNRFMQVRPSLDPIITSAEVVEVIKTIDPAVFEGRLQRFKLAAEKGDALAQSSLGLMYLEQVLLSSDRNESIKWLTKAAEQNFSFAETMLGRAYAGGQGVTQDFSEARKWYGRAAGRGDPLACFSLGQMLYKSGDGDRADFPKALKLLKSAAENGLVLAQSMLGCMYGLGDGTEKNPQQSFHWFRRAADEGYPLAEYFVAKAYDSGEGAPQDKSKAIEFYQKAAVGGHAPAQIKMARCHLNGLDVKKDFATALRWCARAVAQGDAKGKQLLEHLRSDGFRPDDEKSFQTLLKSAANGDVEDQYILFWCYTCFAAADTNQAKELNASAVKWLTIAARQGHLDALKECVRRGIEVEGKAERK